MRAYEFIIESVQYYHGTSNEDFAKSILDSGSLIPGGHNGRNSNNLTPMVDRTYITSDLGYALIYALGSNMIGNPSTANMKGYGYIFKIHKSNIKNRIPDEDKVGELARDIISGDDDHGFADSEINELQALVDYHFEYAGDWVDSEETNFYNTPYEQFIDHEYEWFAFIGKRILENGSNRLVGSFRRNSSQHSGEGKIIIDKAWKFKKSDGAHMKKDGSDFLKYAIEI